MIVTYNDSMWYTGSTSICSYTVPKSIKWGNTLYNIQLKEDTALNEQ